MKQYTINTYEFDELSDEAKEKAIQEMLDINVGGFDWWEFTLDDRKEELQEMGIDNADISFSGFWSQGDGASFTTIRIDLIKLIDSLGLETAFIDLYTAILCGNIDYTARINRIDNHYSHAYTAKLVLDDFNYFNDDLYEEDEDAYYEQYRYYEDLFDKLEKELEYWRIDYCRKIYRQLEDEFTYLTSEEVVIETIRANQYEFNEDGTF